MSAMKCVAGATAAMVLVGMAQGQGVNVAHLRVDRGSMLMVEPCLPPCRCISPARDGAMSGSLSLRLREIGLASREYDVVGLDLTAALPSGEVRYTGTGTYRITTDLAPVQRLVLTLRQEGFPDDEPAQVFDSGEVAVGGGATFPALDVQATTGQVWCTDRTMLLRAVGSTCNGDFNADRSFSVQDVFAFLQSYFAGGVQADINGDRVVSVEDVFAFLEAYFSGCE